ncbi:S24 family peptidase [Chitinophaga japonensis]|uniref:Phage repressor protein C with HTH and peptisase S24 domain n=1 Tax=Chitinophaga japonensis TaxID=104662 RepID=A0A562TBY0_CHIJA|nr:S24 family peptidase [Chitinophaga japonensis]TWI90893.1 phage repressor protein C with HTH and peptisase S24 domain [Chitinophaga japonensis]
MESVTKRFIEFYKYLESKGLIKNATDFERRTGVSKSMVTELIKSRTKVGPITLYKTLSKFDQLDCNWLFHGKGKMLVSDNLSLPDNDIPTIVTVDNEGKDNVLYVNVKAAAGYLSGYADPEFIASLPAFSLPQLKDGTYRMFEVNGHSMYPTYHDKDIVICQFASRSRIKSNQPYVVVTKQDGLLVKRAFNRVKEEGKIFLLSDNQTIKDEYPIIPLDAEDILEMWKVVWSISPQTEARTDIRSTIDEMKAIIARLEEQLKHTDHE